MPFFRRPVSLLVLGLLSAAPAAHASVLYKCNAADGSIAYTSTAQGFRNCTSLGRFADPAPAKPANAPTNAAAVPGRKWVYEENPKEPARADFSAIRAGMASTAPVLATAEADRAPVVKPVAAAKPAVEAKPAPKVLRGAVYRVARRDGIIEYTNVKPAAGAFAVLFTYIATCVACDVHSKIDFARTALNLDAYKAEIAAAAADYGVDSALLRAVIHAESAFNPLAVSSKGAQGLMQLMPGTAGDLGVTDAFDVAQNIRGGARYLAQLLKAFNGDSQLATAAYNAGPGAVQKYGGVPPYDETQVYVQRVATLRDRYQKGM